jgi:hypothetical protein
MMPIANRIAILLSSSSPEASTLGSTHPQRLHRYVTLSICLISAEGRHKIKSYLYGREQGPQSFRRRA